MHMWSNMYCFTYTFRRHFMHIMDIYPRPAQNTEPNVGKFIQTCHLYQELTWIYVGLQSTIPFMSNASQRRSLAYSLLAAVKGSTSCSRSAVGHFWGCQMSPKKVALFMGYDYDRYNIWLVVWGGLEHFLFFHILGCIHHPNWRTHIFQRGGYTTTNQIWYCDMWGDCTSRCGYHFQTITTAVYLLTSMMKSDRAGGVFFKLQMWIPIGSRW